MKTPLQILLDARAFLSDEKRWTKGSFWRGDACCLKGFMTISGNYNSKAYALLSEALPDHFKWDSELARLYDPIVRFNDHPSTTHADVLAVLDKAIALALARQEQQ